MNIKLSKYTVETKDELSWWDLQEVQNVITSGAKIDATGLNGFDGEALLRSKIKLMECAITKITSGDKTMNFSIEWLKELSVADGELLDSEIDKLSKKK